jgi:type I restriction enzyme S subunit
VSWKLARLADICEIKLGKTPSRSDKSYWDDEKLGSNIWVSIADLTKLNSRFIADSKEYITDKGASLFKPVKAGTLLMSFKLSIGKVAYANCDLYTNEAIVALPIKDRNKISSDFLFYFLKFYDWDKETENDVKLKGKTLNKAKLNEIKVPLPPLPTQQNIVAKLDRFFIEIDKATAAAEANAKNAEALFQSYLTEIFERGGEGWFELKLQDLLDKGWIVSHLDGNHGGDYPRKEEFISSGVPYISANCLDGDVLDLSKSKFLSKERASKLRKGLAKTDDVLFAHNATVGPVSILKTTEEVTILGTSLTYYRCNKEFIEPEYLANYMRSIKFKNQYLTIMRQSTRNQIPISKQREFFHVIPPLEQQKELLKKFNVFLSMKTAYELNAKKKINELFLLKKSILKKAFNGELFKE